MEKLSLKSDAESDDPSMDVHTHISKLDKEMESLKVESKEVTLRWESERGGVDMLQELKEQILQVKLDNVKAECDYNLNEAAKLKFAKLPKLEEELKTLGAADASKSDADSTERMLRDKVMAGKHLIYSFLQYCSMAYLPTFFHYESRQYLKCNHCMDRNSFPENA